MSAASDNSKGPVKSPEPVSPGKGMFGWLGRQVGYVRRAVNHPVQDLKATKIYRSARVEEQTLPHLPNVRLRRTTIDELVIDSQHKADVNADDSAMTDKPPTSAKQG